MTILIGNPKPQSRTRQIAEKLVSELLPDGSYDLTIIDLADVSSHIFEWPSETIAGLNAQAAATDLLVVASPTYKATYTGLLKGFFDRYGSDGLRGVTAIPVMTGGDLTHSMGADQHLRPLLVELGASVPTKSLYFVTSDFDDMPAIVESWVADARERLGRTLTVVTQATS